MVRSALAGAFAVAVISAMPSRADALTLQGIAGVGWARGNTYYSIGGGIGEQLALGLEPGVDGTYWGGSTPSFFKLSPRLTWYLPIPLVAPYVGAYYAHWFVGSGFPDADSVGGRAGLALLSLGPVSVRVGFAYERVLSCSAQCDSYGPEASIGLGF